MNAGDYVAVVAAVGAAVLVGAAATLIAALTSTLRDLRSAVRAIDAEVVPLVEELRAAVRDAGREVDRVERLVTAAEGVTEAVDSAQRLAFRTLASPVVKAMAFGAGVSKGAERMRTGGDGAAPVRKLGGPAQSGADAADAADEAGRRRRRVRGRRR